MERRLEEAMDEEEDAAVADRSDKDRKDERSDVWKGSGRGKGKLKDLERSWALRSLTISVQSLGIRGML